eukprot:PhF_6_TR44473/c0_g1_i1/m.68472
MVYDAMTTIPYRSWNPAAVYDALGVTLPTTTTTTSTNKNDSTNATMMSLYAVHREHDAKQKRTLHHTLRSLHDDAKIFRGLFTLDKEILRFNNQFGNRILQLALSKPVYRLFPKGDSGQLSDFHQICVDPYTLETVYDVLEFKAFIRPNFGNSYQSKGMVIRNMFTELYLIHAIPYVRCKYPVGVQALSDYAYKALATEIVLVKLVEYTARAEIVWKELNQCGVVAGKTEVMRFPDLDSSVRAYYPNIFPGKST